MLSSQRTLPLPQAQARCRGPGLASRPAPFVARAARKIGGCWLARFNTFNELEAKRMLLLLRRGGGTAGLAADPPPCAAQSPPSPNAGSRRCEPPVRVGAYSCMFAQKAKEMQEENMLRAVHVIMKRPPPWGLCKRVSVHVSGAADVPASLLLLWQKVCLFHAKSLSNSMLSVEFQVLFRPILCCGPKMPSAMALPCRPNFRQSSRLSVRRRLLGGCRSTIVRARNSS